MKPLHYFFSSYSRAVYTALILAVVPIISLYGCSLGLSSSSKGKTSVVKIGVIVPLSGPLGATGIGIKNSADLAVRNINKSHILPKIKLELDAQDDAATPATARQVAGQLIDDKKVLGVVGTLNSSTAQIILPMLDQANLAMISPANTNNTLTQGVDWTTKKVRPHRGYYRLVGYDSSQGDIASNYVKDKLNISRVAVINDKKAYGVGLSNNFASAFQKRGGTITLNDSIDENEKNFSAIIEKIKQSSPQAVYYGGEFPQASLLSYQMKSSGLQIPLIGGDGIFDEGYLKNCDKCNGDYATVTGEPLNITESGKKFLKDYKAAGYRENPSAFGGEAYDAVYAIAHGIITATTKLKHDGVLPTRKEVSDSIQYDNFPGVTSVVQFDSFGDVLKPKFSIYYINNNKWHYISSYQSQDSSSSSSSSK